MVEKMNFLSITGPQNDIDRVMQVYLGKYEIHLENALTELDEVHDLRPFVEINPYKDILNRSSVLIEKLGDGYTPAKGEMTGEEASALLLECLTVVDDLTVKKKEIRAREKELADIILQFEPFRQLDYDLQSILHFKFIKFRFGRIAHEYYDKFSKYLYDNLNTVFLECESNRDYVWGVYFVPSASAVKIDAIFSSLHFERLILPDAFNGTPEEAHQQFSNELSKLKEQSHGISMEIKEKLKHLGGTLLLAYNTLLEISYNYEIRKLAACTKEKQGGHVFYILCGWMSRSDTKKFLKEIENDPNVYCFSHEGQESLNTKPPTKLKNPKIIKPFEMFIKMYGLPAYHEIDPTLFVALTYTLMFGIMFGDVGQGLCLVIGGFLLYRIKKMNIAAVISLAGVWSTIFGFMYGSVFGFEETLKPLWRRPMEFIMPTLITAVVFGVILILVAMIINIINGIRAKDVEKIFFDPSGLAGLLCYGAVVGCVGLAFTGHTLPAGIILAILIGLPLLAIFLKEPLTNLVKKEKHIFPKGSKAMFFVEALVELFDVILSYATNTISFVRIGAFALSHAGMMGVVLTLANVSEAPLSFMSIIILIIGNILVTGLEGLVVGIQVLRLEYYEMFSRFYRGTGKEFKPFKSNRTN